MKKEHSAKINYLYNLFLQIVNLLVPLIATPYISQVFTSETIGELSYTQSIINYLILFGNLGTSIFSVRQIAYMRGDDEKQGAFISNMVLLKLLILCPVVVVYVIIILSSKEFSLLLISEVLLLLGETMSIDWYYTGNEFFKITVIRSTLIKMVGLALILTFINSPKDKCLYCFILGGTLIIGNAVLWIKVLTKVKFQKPSMVLLKIYFWGSLVLFLPQIAGSIYLYCDKIMIKFLSSGIVENGYYEQADKIIRLSITVISALPTVMLPRISAAFSQGDQGSISEYMTKSLEFVFLLGMPISLGLVGISDNIVPWFFGYGYDKVSILLKVLSPIVLINAIYNVVGYQYLLAVKKEKIFTISIICGACINIVLNFILIPRFDSVGACIASVFSEMTVTIIEVVYAHNVLRISKTIKNIMQTAFGASTMLFVINFFSRNLTAGMLHTFLLIVIGALVYGMMMFVMQNTLVMESIQMIKKKICSK